ncbi:uncharacterized protein clmnb [Parambassis ranga]|uniref:Calmin n=1 Tax=Parambassis ranga TaxID=210632 RepID=A0A6P7HEQ9_9TELE|nr:uncharacterized protein LOC114428364 [Parambassis ranga]
MQDSWGSQMKAAGEISDQNQDDSKTVQKRTFTRWMNVFLQRHDPPLEVHDLFTDIQDGRILMALLEVLSGCKLLYRFRPSSHRIFRLSNISKALAFLDDRHVKLLGIDASAIADGTPSVVLSLVWNIILYFQVKEVTAGLGRHLSSSLSSLSVSSYSSCGDLSPQPNDIGSFSCSTLPSKSRKAARESKYHGKAIKTLLQWIQRCTSKYGVEVYDFGKSWRSGLAFLALIKSIKPDLVDLKESLSREPKENIQHAFTMAHHSLDITPLLDPEDVTCTSPDEQSIITYLSMFLGHHAGFNEDCTTYTEVPEIPNFGSPQSVIIGETIADYPEAQALLKGLERSREQLLWRQWSWRSSGSLSCPSLHTNGEGTSDPSSTGGNITEQPAVTSASDKMKRRVFQPPSPLDARVANLEIRSWMEQGLDRGYSIGGVDESHFSLSSEDGVDSLSALDSDEEDAYSYILDLNKEVFQPHCQVKRQVPKVEEEMSKVSTYLGAYEIFNGGKHQEAHCAKNTDIDPESNVDAQPAADREFDLDNNESILREMTNNGAVFVLQPGAESKNKEECEERRVVRGRSNDDGDSCETERETENVRLVNDGYYKPEDDIVKAEISEVVKWQKDVEDGAGRGGAAEELSEKWGQVSEQRTMQDDLRQFEKERDVRQQHRGEVFVKKESCMKLYEVRKTSKAKTITEEESDRRDTACEDEENSGDEVISTADLTPVQRSDGKELQRHKYMTTARDHPGEATSQNDTDQAVDIHDGGDIRPPACGETSQPFSEGGFTLHSLAASCDITPLELRMLLFLWILLYCCLILPQINLR